MRAEYGAAALTRLALSDAVRDLVDDAVQLIPTLNDHAGSPDRHLAQALRLRAQAGEVVTGAVLHGRAGGWGWPQNALLIERWIAEGKDSSHPVSGGLPPPVRQAESR